MHYNQKRPLLGLLKVRLQRPFAPLSLFPNPSKRLYSNVTAATQKNSQAKRGLARLRPSEDLGLTIGSVHHGFRVDSINYIKDFDMSAYHMQHEITKAMYLHVDCADTNNVFSVAFRTPPSDSTGIAHILEHCVLCGSESYPVRDPFFNMLKRSLNTFMNAMTASDHTMYPFATLNQQDFSNLLKVYLDATFFPLLRENDFLQEGHRLEFTPVEEGAEEAVPDLIRSGVVFNEMKGTLSNANTLFHLGLQRELFPRTPYAHVSGGDPSRIPELTYEDLKSFHKLHYHPSNSIFFSYGDLNVLDHMEVINKNVLQRFEYSEDSFKIKDKLLENMGSAAAGVVNVSTTGPPESLGKMEKQAKFCMIKELDIKTADEYEGLVLRLLGTLLLDGLNSPIYEALINSQLAPDYAPGTGCDTSLMTTQFGVGVQGIRSDDETLSTIKETIQKTLEKTAEVGFDPVRVEAALHQIELALKHKQTHFGLMVLYAATNTWTHGISKEDDVSALQALITESISVNNKLKRLVTEISENDQFWQDQIKKHLLNENLREVHMLMEPDEDFTQKQDAKEKEELLAIKNGLNECQIQEIVSMNEELAAEREQYQNPSCLPTLSIADIPREPSQVIQLTYAEEDDAEENINGRGYMKPKWLSFAELEESTNDIAYLSLFFDAYELVPMELRSYLPIFCSLVGNVDTRDFTYQELAVQSELTCGGVSFNTIVASWLGGKENAEELKLNLFGENDSNLYRQGIMVNVHCLERNIDRTLDLVAATITGSLFGNDLGHLSSLLNTMANSAINSVSSDPLTYGNKWGIAPLSEEFMLQEVLSGLTQVKLTLKLAELAAKDEIGTLIPTLDAIARIVFRPENMRVRVVAGNGNRTYIENSFERFASRFGETVDQEYSKELPSLPLDIGSGVLQRSLDTTYIPIDNPVHACSLVVPTGVGYKHRDSAAMTVLSQILSSLYLHREIREKGGAYGSNAGHLQSGILQMSSFYDPNTVETIKAFGRGIDWICNGEFTSRDVDEAVISVFGSIDSPKNPATKGVSEFLHGLLPEDRQQYRDNFFEVDKEMVFATANAHLASYKGLSDSDWTNFNATERNGSICVIGSREQCPDTKDPRFSNWTVSKPFS